jgi:hypothetical protein
MDCKGIRGPADGEASGRACATYDGAIRGCEGETERDTMEMYYVKAETMSFVQKTKGSPWKHLIV